MEVLYITLSCKNMAQAMRRRLTIAPQLPLAYGLSASNLFIMGTNARRIIADQSFVSFDFNKVIARTRSKH